MLDDEQVIGMRRRSRLPVVVSIGSKRSTCVKGSKPLLKIHPFRVQRISHRHT